MDGRRIGIGAALGLVTSLVAFAGGCEGIVVEPGGPRGPAGTGPGTDCDMQAILSSPANRCVSCHDSTPGVEGGNLDLLSPDVGARLLDQPSGNSRCGGALLVDGENPQESMLLRLVDPARHAAWGDDACVAMMPFESDGVSDHDVQCFERWVEDIAAGRDPGGPTGPPPAPFEPMPPEAALAKAKYILHGGPMTDDELARVTAPDGTLDREGLRDVITSWRGTPELERKLRDFLRLSLQQDNVDVRGNYQLQLDPMGGDSVPDRRAVWSNLEESFVHTAWHIVEGGQDFREVVTTRTWRVTTAMLAALVYTEDERTPLFSGVRFADLAYLEPGDYEDWRSVTFTQASSPSEVIAFEHSASFVEQLRSIPDGGTLALMAPRVGFFNTPVFFDSWRTNADNQFRVTTSQTLITALDMAFEAGDVTEVTSLNGLADEHAEPGTACYQCHQRLDPMRLQFMNAYSFRNRVLEDRSNFLAPSFSFDGVTAEPQTVDELAGVIANHPRFATAWTQKLCMWANSARCDETDPEFRRVVDVFARDFDLWDLLLELFTSPLVTGAESTVSHERSEFLVVASRTNHLCNAFEVRLDAARADRCEADRAADPMGPEPDSCTPRNPVPICNSSVATRNVAGILSEDAYVRGEREFVQETLVGPFKGRALSELCTLVARAEVGPWANHTFSPSDPEGALDRMVEFVMGLPPTHPRYEAAREGLAWSLEVAQMTPLCADTGQDLVEDNRDEVVCGLGIEPRRALHVPWAAACGSPDLAGVGL